jgi:hypothetical protein
MVFQQPQKFLDLCEKLKSAKPNTDGAKEFAPKSNGIGYMFEYITGKTLTELAKSFGAEFLQSEDASKLFKPFAAEPSSPVGYGYAVFRDGIPMAEFDAVLKVDKNEYWFFESTAVIKGDEKFFANKQLLLLWGIAKQHKVSCAYVLPIDTYQQFSSSILSKYKNITKEFLGLNAELTYVQVTKDDLHSLLGRKKN